VHRIGLRHPLRQHRLVFIGQQLRLGEARTPQALQHRVLQQRIYSGRMEARPLSAQMVLNRSLSRLNASSYE
jgi:hypothetical protein